MDAPSLPRRRWRLPKLRRHPIQSRYLPECRSTLISWWRSKTNKITDFAHPISDEDLAHLLCWKLDADIHDRREFAEAFLRVGTQDSESLTYLAELVGDVEKQTR
jgi:hypothetical protein